MERVPISCPPLEAELWRTAAPVRRLAVLLLPVPMDLSHLPLYKRDEAALLALWHMNWNALPPWPAPPLREGDAPFAGGAADFLSALTGRVLPAACGAARIAPTETALIGISLSGLFALWATCETDAFTACAALSGSFWYDRFTRWLRTASPRARRYYLALGRKEKMAGNPRLAAIETATDEVAAILAAKGANLTRETFPGGHRTTPDRLSRALRWLLDEK